jgi:sugar lactone lactonase YvrE
MAFCSQASGQGGVITTVAGNGAIDTRTHMPGFSGDGGPATSASLYLSYVNVSIVGVAVDASGNLFIADCGNDRIRKVSVSGIITTIAGGGSSGDGGAATAASLRCPGGVAVDASGNLFIADNGRIRKVSASGIITTVAAGLSAPKGIVVDASGNLFIADTGNNRIRKVSASGIITTVAGSGAVGLKGGGFSGDGGLATAASLNFPTGIAVDASGNLFIADALNNRIRKVSADGIITTVAGSGAFGHSNDRDPRKSRATSAELYHPGGVAVDASGNLFIADTGNNRIRTVPVGSGMITTVAGSGAIGTGNGGFSGDGGAATRATLNSPTDVAVDASGNLFIADALNNRIRKVSASAGR